MFLECDVMFGCRLTLPCGVHEGKSSRKKLQYYKKIINKSFVYYFPIKSLKSLKCRKIQDKAMQVE